MFRWLSHTRSSKFYINSSRDLVHRLLQAWRTKRTHVLHLHSLSSRFIKRAVRIEFQNMYGLWKTKTAIRRWQNDFIARRNLRLLGKTLELWQIKTSQLIKSKRFHERCTSRHFFRLWQHTLIYQRRLKDAEKFTMERRDYNIGRYVIRYWVILERGRFLEHVRDTRCLQYHIGVWVGKRRGIQSRLEAMHALYIDHSAIKALHLAWLAWHQRFKDICRAEKVAEEWCRAKTIHHFLKAMKRRSEQITALYVASHQIRIQLTRHRIIKIWRKKTRKKRVARWLRMCKRRRLQDWYNLWVKLHRQKKYEVVALQKLHAMARLRVCRVALEVWHSNVIYVIDCDLRAVQVSRRNIIHTYMVRWKARKQDLSDLTEIAQHFLAQIDYVAKKQLFVYWLGLTRRLRENHLRLDGYLSSERARLLCHVLKWWQEVLCERRLTGTENAVRSRGEKSCKLRTLQTWIARSYLISILRRSRKTCAVTHLQIWRISTREKLDRLKAIKIDCESLSKVYFARWLQKFLDIKASKMINRFKNPSTLKRGKSCLSGDRSQVETDEEPAHEPNGSLMIRGNHQVNGYHSTLSSLMQRPNKF